MDLHVTPSPFRISWCESVATSPFLCGMSNVEASQPPPPPPPPSLPLLFPHACMHVCRYQDDSGDVQTLSKLPQDVSELLQHEMDHCDGVLAVCVSVRTPCPQLPPFSVVHLPSVLWRAGIEPLEAMPSCTGPCIWRIESSLMPRRRPLPHAPRLLPQTSELLEGTEPFDLVDRKSPRSRKRKLADAAHLWNL